MKTKGKVVRKIRKDKILKLIDEITEIKNYVQDEVDRMNLDLLEDLDNIPFDNIIERALMVIDLCTEVKIRQSVEREFVTEIKDFLYQDQKDEDPRNNLLDADDENIKNIIN